MAKNRFTWWNRVKDSDTRTALEEQGQAISNLEAADTPSTSPANGCLATRTSAQNITGTFTQIVWTSATWNPAGELDTSTGTFTAAADGYYAIAFYCYVSGIGSTNTLTGYINHNGAQVGYIEERGSRVAHLSIPLYPLTAGDTLKFLVSQNTGATQTTDSNLAGCYLSIVKIGDL